MKEIIYLNRFKKDIKKLMKQGKDMNKLKAFLQLLLDNHVIPERYRKHILKGKFNNHWDVHLEPDWVLIYFETDTSITFVRTGSHSELFC